MTHLSRHLTDAQAQGFLDGLLGDAEAAEVAAHADACPACNGLVESYRSLCRSLEDLSTVPELPVDFTADVLERVERVERAAARERRAAVAVVAGAFLALVAVTLAGGFHGWIPATAQFADQVGVLAQALRLGAQVLPILASALRLPLAVGTVLLAVPLILALSPLLPSLRTEAT